MAKKNEEKIETAETKKVSDFDLEKELTDLQRPDMFKAGLKYHIDINNLECKSKKDFDKIVKEYGELSIGG